MCEEAFFFVNLLSSHEKHIICKILDGTIFYVFLRKIASPVTQSISCKVKYIFAKRKMIFFSLNINDHN